MDATFESVGLWGLFASSFLSATLLPGNSELALVALLHHAPELDCRPSRATLGNTLGGFTSYLIGRLFPRRATVAPRMDAPLRNTGVAAAWAPLIGDALSSRRGGCAECAAALRYRRRHSQRYWMLATGLELLS